MLTIGKGGKLLIHLCEFLCCHPRYQKFKLDVAKELGCHKCFPALQFSPSLTHMIILPVIRAHD